MQGVRPALLAFWFSGYAMAVVYNNTIGGTRLRQMPGPYLVLITEIDPWIDNPQPDCVGVSAGNFMFRRPLIFASFECVPGNPPIKKLRSAQHELITAGEFEVPDQPVDKFRIAFLEIYPSDASIPEFANLITDRTEFQRHLSDEEAHGFALAVHTNPVLALVVTWDQTGCAELYAKLKLPDWPTVIRDGGFCVFSGKTDTRIKILGRNYNIKVGIPCDDAEGSPVLISNFTKVLGIIVKTFCLNGLNVAFAMSTAFLPTGFEPTTAAPTTTVSPPTIPPPPPQPRVADPVIPCSSTKLISDILLCLLPTYCSQRLVLGKS